MDVTDMGAKEPPFVGEQRRELVDRLLADFDQLSESGTPRWWSLEGHSGWGKTRIVQEFYRRLATERQPGVQYWPPSLTPVTPLAKNVGLATSMRKRVYPEQVVREPDATPAWFWWGIACAARSGTPVQALADDLTQFTQHQVGLQRRWGQLVSPAARIGARLSSKRGEIIDTAVGEGLSAAASLASVTIPLLGVLVLAAKWGVQGLRGSHSAAGTPVVDATGGGRADLVAELAPALERLAAAGLPIVITVEDLHLADESLVELLARLLAAKDARVLVISTAWRGLLDEEHRPAHRLLKRVASGRVHRVLAEDDLPDLGLNERQEIVTATLPGVSAWNAGKLAKSYTNPWALQLACNVGWVRRAARDLTDEEVARLPRDVEGLFTQLWQELPEDTRTMLMVAALSTPTGISDSMGFGDARWEPSLLAAVAATEAWLRASAGNLADVLGRTSDSYAWIRVVDEWLRRFQDPGQNDVAVSHAKTEYDGAERRRMYEAMARCMSAGVAKSPTQQLHQARLLVALASEGFLAWDQTTLAGAVTLCASLLAAPDVESRRYVIMIAEHALRSTSSEPPVAGPRLTLRGLYGSALAESGRVTDAIRVFEELVADQEGVIGPDASDTLATRHNLAGSLGQLGHVDQAIVAFESLLADRTRVLGPDAPDTLATRDRLAWWIADSGRVDEAITAFEELLADRTRVLGPDAPAALTTCDDLAWTLGRAGRADQAVAAFEKVLADRTRVLGPDAPDTLNTRHRLAWRLGRSGRVDEATTAFEEVLAARTRVLGPDAPDTLATRDRLAWWLAESGRVDEAITAFEQLLADQRRVLGSEAYATLRTRHRLASLLGRSGRVSEAITVFEQLLVDQRRVLGPEAPRTLATRDRLAWWLAESGRVDEAITAFEQLLADRTRVLGPDDRHTLVTRDRLAWWIAESGRVEEALTVFRQVLADRTRVLGPDAPAALDTRQELAWWLGQSGRVDEAITAFDELLVDCTRVLGPDAPATLDARSSLGWWLGESGLVDYAITALEQVLADRVRVLGPHAPATLDARGSLGWWLGESGLVDEAITALEEVLVDQRRVLDSDAPATLTTRSSLAWWLGESGQVDEAITALEEVLVDQRRVLDSDAPATLTTHSNLAWWLGQSGQVEEAISMFERVLVDQRRVLDSDAPATLTTRHRLAWCLAKLGLMDQAITALESLLPDQVRVLGPDAPGTRATRDRLAELGAI